MAPAWLQTVPPCCTLGSTHAASLLVQARPQKANRALQATTTSQNTPRARHPRQPHAPHPETHMLHAPPVAVWVPCVCRVCAVWVPCVCRVLRHIIQAPSTTGPLSLCMAAKFARCMGSCTNLYIQPSPTTPVQSKPNLNQEPHHRCAAADSKHLSCPTNRNLYQVWAAPPYYA